jgi:cytochrome c oxidase subunit 2
VSFLAIGDLLGLLASNLVTISGFSVFVISAVDVIHAIAIPTTGLKLDAIPGRLSTTKFDCELAGVYAGQCSELCGALHGFMPVQLLVFLNIKFL